MGVAAGRPTAAVARARCARIRLFDVAGHLLTIPFQPEIHIFVLDTLRTNESGRPTSTTGRIEKSICMKIHTNSHRASCGVFGASVVSVHRVSTSCALTVRLRRTQQCTWNGVDASPLAFLPRAET